MESATRLRAFGKPSHAVSSLAFYQLWMMGGLLILVVLHAIVLYNVYNGSNSVQSLAVDARKTGALSATADLSAYVTELIIELRRVHASGVMTDALLRVDELAKRLTGITDHV